MLKHVLFVIICSVLGLLVWILIRASSEEVLALESPLPKLTFIDKMGNTEIIYQQGRMVLVLYFHRTCDHCQYQLEVLNTHCKDLSGLKIYLFTSEQNFFQEPIKWGRLQNAENITFGIVNKNRFYKNFGTLVTPSIFIFDQAGSLTEKIHGEIKFEALLKEISGIHQIQE